jgi:hypothetical protein
VSDRGPGPWVEVIERVGDESEAWICGGPGFRVFLGRGRSREAALAAAVRCLRSLANGAEGRAVRLVDGEALVRPVEG